LPLLSTAMLSGLLEALASDLIVGDAGIVPLTARIS
jgi:hypothetical protein